MMTEQVMKVMDLSYVLEVESIGLGDGFGDC